MKINFIISFFIINISFLISNLNAETIFFDSKNIKIENDGNLIYATDGLAKITNQNVTIEGKKSIYNKFISELTVIGNVKFFDNLNNVYIESEKAIYNEIDNTILTSGKTFIKLEDKYKINSKNVLFDRNTIEEAAY